MKALSAIIFGVCIGCGGSAFTGLDSASRTDGGALVDRDGGALEPSRDDAGALDRVDVVDAGDATDADPNSSYLEATSPDAGDALEVERDAGAELDASEDHHVASMCTASECPACPPLERQCCNTQTLQCGCSAGLSCL